MANINEVIPTNQFVFYILAACLVFFPMLAYRDTAEFFGTPAVLHFAMLTGFGGAVSALALVSRGDRLLSLLPGAIGGIVIALSWHTLLHSSSGANLGSGKSAIAVILIFGGLIALVLFLLIKKLFRRTAEH